MLSSRRLLSVGLPAIALTALLAAPVLAVIPGTLDQHNNDTTGATPNTGVQYAQTFTAGLTGELTDVRLYCMGYGADSSVNDDTIALYSVTAGAPDQLLGTSAQSDASSSCDSTGSWVDFTFTGHNVVAGTQYAVVIGGNDAWGMSPSDAYAGGSACNGGEGWSCGQPDYLFETYVLAAAATPTPPATATPRATATPQIPTQPPTDTAGTTGGGTANPGLALVLVALGVAATVVVLPMRRIGRNR
jgi:hypothetical protein